MKELQAQREVEMKQAREKMLMEQEDHVSRLLSSFWYKNASAAGGPKEEADDSDFLGSTLRKQIEERRRAEEDQRCARRAEEDRRCARRVEEDRR